MEHYFTKKPTVAKKETEFQYTIDHMRCFFTTSSGMFSIEHVDIGSRILISHAHIEKNWRVLDLGCGYGPIGIFLLKKEPTLSVVFSDVNERATSYALKNVLKNKIDSKHVSIVCGEGYSAVDGKFDAVFLNPPQSAGKKVCEQLIAGAKTVLKSGGVIQIVARKNKGGATLAAFMEKEYDNIKVLGKKSGFWVWESKNE